MGLVGPTRLCLSVGDLNVGFNSRNSPLGVQHEVDSCEGFVNELRCENLNLAALNRSMLLARRR
jgi:hypothetical protein